MFMRSGDIVVHHALSGDGRGRPLVLVNSLGTDLRVWDALLPALERSFRVIRYDKRGHGLTDLSPGPYTIPQLASDLERLLDALDVRGAIVVGLSIGGMIAQQLAVGRPDLVAGLVLMDTSHKIGTAETWQQRIDAVRTGGIASIADAILERWFARAFRERHPDELAGWRNMLIRTPVEGYLGCCAAIRDADLGLSTAALRLPALCLVGEEDGATPPALVLELARLIPDAAYVTVPEAGHLPCVEQPDRVAQVIRTFLEEKGFA
ncbi:3-oxoadipate enol-lactonase [Benzoatithermus flavus]|uniref:3-oxoadipate enol-lactonase n=1 Tax=Benzoatithermus flavus TaxID=3108223 RepID=A0ABU8XTU3_9PROT